MTAAESLNPESSLWHYIAVHLRKERLRRKLTLTDVAMIIGADKARVSSYEAGRLRITVPHAEALDQAWGTMIAVLRKIAVKISLDEDWAKQLWDFEDGALIIKIYFGEVVPGPAQTEDYARALVTAGRIVRDIDKAVKRRLERKKMLMEQLASMRLWLLVDERAFHLPGIPPEVMRGQAAALLELSQEASVRIVPIAALPHVGVEGDFELITTTSGAEVAYVWAQLGGRLVHDTPDWRELALRWDQIGASALTEEGSRDFLRNKLERLK
ncbi:helix-turn-helix domain-containing protein [Actinomadura hibisca]|uniref:helix-turn-helix domain-containing protein n=1 Tax=Actinomadura hibisca TaxID=68565 RepID=UPI000832E99D|nr:helix-turn-helix transcriptional regulator [Actinomadura hibisca]